MKSLFQRRATVIFDTWAQRASVRPEDFREAFNEDGSPAEGYGETCALFFQQLEQELDAKGLLPRSDSVDPS